MYKGYIIASYMLTFLPLLLLSLASLRAHARAQKDVAALDGHE